MSEATTNKTEMRRGPKLNPDIVKLSDLDPGASVKGKYIGSATAPWTDRSNGQVKDLTRHVFEKLDEKTARPIGERFAVFEDAGLKNALAAALVKEGMCIEIVKGEQQDLGGGKRVNSYDVYPLQ